MEWLDRHANASRCAVDLEADNMHSYEEKLCLIQMKAGGEIVLIDPFSIENVEALKSFLDSREVWMHGADYDFSLFLRAFSWVPRQVFDTQVAARLVGYRRFGLASLMEECFDLEFCKKSQREDWSQRPLPQEMCDYAALDVEHLLELADLLLCKLEDTGRTKWFQESCEAARTQAMERPMQEGREPWRINGSGKLSRRGLGYLEALWNWRDGKARTRDVPAFKVLQNQWLIDWCLALEEGRPMPWPRRFNEQRKKQIQALVNPVKGLPKEELPEKLRGKRLAKDKGWDGRVAGMRKVRDAAAQELDVESSLIAPRWVIERLASQPEEAEQLLLQWQRQLMRLDENLLSPET